jgi:hypothetical protein
MNEEPYYNSKCYTRDSDNIWIICNDGALNSHNSIFCTWPKGANDEKKIRCDHYNNGYNCRRIATHFSIERIWSTSRYTFVRRCSNHQFCEKIPH